MAGRTEKRIRSGYAAMTQETRDRILREADMAIDTGATVREIAAALGTPKSTVHSDLRIGLEYVDRERHGKALAVLAFNLEDRHRRGGVAVHRKRRERDLPAGQDAPEPASGTEGEAACP